MPPARKLESGTADQILLRLPSTGLTCRDVPAMVIAPGEYSMLAVILHSIACSYSTTFPGVLSGVLRLFTIFVRRRARQKIRCPGSQHMIEVRR
jgi:hypothetical protein